MIDPRALQQHFNKVRQREQPQKQLVPRVPDLKPLTAVQAIPVIEPVVLEPMQPAVIEPIVLPSVDTSELQKELLEVTQALTTLKQALTQTPQIEPVTITVPVSVATIVTEVKEVEEELIIKKPEPKPVEEENPYGYSTPKSQDDKEEYNPYGYYSGPLF